MFSESSHRPQERILDALPSDIVDFFLSDPSLRDAPIIFSAQQETIRRLFSGGEEYSGLRDVGFCLDYREKKHDDSKEGSFGQLRFEYLDDASEENYQHHFFAQMHFNIIDKNHFELVHRYVSPEMRRSGLGVGTKLYSLAEHWFLQIASETRKPVFISLQAGQKSVFSWAEKLGFSVIKSQQELRREIDEHPERFFEDEVFVSEESQKEGVVKDKYIFALGTEERYMEKAVRLTFEKRIIPVAKDFSVDGGSSSK